MLKLEQTGQPIYIDLENGASLSFNEPIVHEQEKFKVKLVKDMAGLLQKDDYLPGNEKFYDYYRGIVEKDTVDTFTKFDDHYDLTIIMPNDFDNGECKKTSGHYHKYIPGHHSSYAEIYEVILGKALFILQKINDHELPADQIQVEDLYFVEVNQGEMVVLPPLYGHCSINVGEGPMVFSNIASCKNKSDYRVVKEKHGMSYYIVRENGKLKAVKNPNYGDVPAPRVMKVLESREMGIVFHKPLYRSYLENPALYGYVANPLGHEAAMMNLLKETNPKGLL